MYSRKMNNNKVSLINCQNILLCSALLTGLFFSIAFATPLQARMIDLNVAATKPVNGIVGDLDSFSFQLATGESLLIEVKRINTSFSLKLSRIDNKPVFLVRLPSSDWLAERILVTSDDCSDCRLQVQPFEKADQSGLYQLTATKLKEKADSAKIEFEKKMTLASRLWAQAGSNQRLLNEVYGVYLEAVAIANQSDMSDERQRSRYLAAQAADWSVQYTASEQLAIQVIDASKDAHDPYRLRAYALLADFAFEEHQLKKSLSYADLALKLALLQNDKLMQASIYNRLGLLASEQGRSRDAYQLFDKSHQTFLLLGDWRRAVNGMINKGWSSYRQGKLEEALNYYQQALSVSQSSGLLQQEVDAAYKTGEVYTRWGDIDQANRFIDSALAKAEPFKQSLLYGRVLQAKGNVLRSSGMFHLAKAVFEDALQAYMQLPSKKDTVNIQSFLGEIHSSLGNLTIAENYFKQVLAFDLQSGNQYLLSQSYSRLAEMALKQKNFKKALGYQQQALNDIKVIDDDNIKGRLFSQAAIIFYQNNLLNEAEDYFSRARKIQKKLHDYNGQIETGYRIATMRAHQGNHKQALIELDEVVRVIRAGRNKITRADLKRSYLALQQKIAALQIHLLKQASVPAKKTLQVAEMFRSQTLRERLEDYRVNRSIPDELALKRNTLHSQLQSKAVDYHQLSDPQQRKALLSKTRKLAAQLQRLEASIEQVNDLSLKRSSEKKQSLSLANIDQLQKQLSEDSILLYFDTNPEQSHLWTVSRKVVRSFTLPADTTIAGLVADALKVTSSSPAGNKRKRKQAQKAAYNKLSKMLFSAHSVAWEQYQRIVLITDGPLNYLPFSMLTLPGSQTPILNSKQVTFAPSLSVYQQLSARSDNKKISATTNNRVLLVANPSFLEQNKPSSRVAKLRSGFQTSELPYTSKEAKSIMKVMPGSAVLLSRHQANKTEFYKRVPQNFQILHFATHGLASSESASLGGLVFSNTRSADNLLLAPEIASLHLEAELVVLSGCETALGRLVDGEGLQGLSRAFFEAGAKRVIASLWAVQDDATAELMGAFYRFMLIGKKTPAEALRQAKLHVRNYRRKNNQKPWQDPYYWAGFVLQGIGESWIE